MKVCPLIRIFSLAPEICPNVLLTEDVFYTPHYCQAIFLYDRVLSFCWAQLLAGVTYWVQPLFSCNSNSRFICYWKKTVSSGTGSFSNSSCISYSLSSEYARSCASFHCACSDFPFLRRFDSSAETSAKAGMWSL